MSVEIAPFNLRIHRVPLAEITLDHKYMTITIDLDDEDKVRRRLIFVTGQALKVTTIDCFDAASILVDGEWQKRILRVVDSPWIAALGVVLHENDDTANFLERSTHYILPLGDFVAEIVAHTCRLETGQLSERSY